MTIGADKQYDLSWEELDKIKRRLELKQRIKEEGVRARYDPFRAMKGEIFSDPATLRFLDHRKRGRLPYVAVKPKIFFSVLGILFLPIIGLTMLVNWERRDYVEGCRTGDIPYEDRKGLSNT